MTDKELTQIMPFSKPANRDKYLPHLNQMMPIYGIDTPARAAMFIAQLAHESGSLRYNRELASGEAYEGRKDLGNDRPGDGVRFRGRGLIQITGRANYRAVSKALGVDFEAAPERLEEPSYAVESACWFWREKKLNAFADKGDIRGASKRINGGYNGLADRTDYYRRACEVLKA